MLVSESAAVRGEGEQNSSLLNSSRDRIKRVVYDFFQSLNDPDTKTAIKIGLGAALLSFPAFWDVTRPLFHEYRGQWAVVSYMIVTASTLGQTNFLVTMRILGTLVGSGVAIIAYHIFWEDPVALPLLGFLFSIPCFWLIVCFPVFTSIGRFSLLSYNLVCLYSYNVRDDNVHILVTAYRRIVCVLIGVLFGWVINNFMWPYKARRELRKCLSEFLLECAYLYSFLVKRYSSPAVISDRINRVLEEDEVAIDDERLPLLSNNEDIMAQPSCATAEFSNMELFLRVKLIRLFDLLSSTQHEPRLKGPFPMARYRKMLNACQTLLDMLHSLRSVTAREDWFQSIRSDFLLPLQSEHRELVGNILLYLSLLSTSIELKSPLPPYLPAAHQSRERLLSQIKKLPIVIQQQVSPQRPVSLASSLTSASVFPPNKASENCNIKPDSTKVPSTQGAEITTTTGVTTAGRRSNYLLFFAFSVALRNIIRELESIGFEAQELFGIIGGIKNLDEFEEIFNQSA